MDLTLLLVGASYEEWGAGGGRFCDEGGGGTFLPGADPEAPIASDFFRSAFSVSYLSIFS